MEEIPYGSSKDKTTTYPLCRRVRGELLPFGSTPPNQKLFLYEEIWKMKIKYLVTLASRRTPTQNPIAKTITVAPRRSSHKQLSRPASCKPIEKTQKSPLDQQPREASGTVLSTR